MGRVFIRENLVKSATPSSLYTRDNYQFLSQNNWSLTACEQVLANHQAARQQHPAGRTAFDPINKALNERINKTTSLAELRQVVEEQAHRMTQINLAVVIQRVPQLLFTRTGAQDYDAAALLLDHAANLLLPKLQYLSGPNICTCLAMFAKCCYSPSGEMLQAMSSQLLDNKAKKLQHCGLYSLAHLMQGQSRLVQPQGQWPLLQAVLQQVTEQLQQLLQPQSAAVAAAQEGVSSSSSSHRGQSPGDARTGNAVAQLAWLLDRAQLQSPEYLEALHRWMAVPENLAPVTAMSVVQLWAAVRGQYTKHHRMTLAAAAAEEHQQQDLGSSAASSSPSSDSSSPTAAAGDSLTQQPAAADAAAGDAELPSADGDAAAAAAGSSSSSTDELQLQQPRLREFFGPQTLDVLAAKTAQMFSTMTERELGLILASVSSVKYINPDLMAAAAVAFEAMYAAGTPSKPTLVSAAWAAALLRCPKPALLQPALVEAASKPRGFDGTAVGRLLRLTSWLSEEELLQQRTLLLQELHRRSGARGPAPAGPAAAAQSSSDSSSAEGSSRNSSNPEWVTAIADDVATRIGELKPREIAHLVSAFAAIPGVQLHEGLFGAAAAHIETHAHTFTTFSDMELVASAFEKLNFKAGLPALKALQQQAEQLAASKF